MNRAHQPPWILRLAGALFLVAGSGRLWLLGLAGRRLGTSAATVLALAEPAVDLIAVTNWTPGW